MEAVNGETATLQPPIGSPPTATPVNNDFVVPNTMLNGSDAYTGSTTVGGTTFMLAPGSERAASSGVGSSGITTHQGQHSGSANTKVVVMDYTTDFPELPVGMDSNANKPVTGAWAKPIPMRAAKSNIITQVFHLPAEERKNKSFDRQFGTASEEQQKCNQIASETGTKIELSESRDHTLTILITGKRDAAEDARARIVRELQTQAKREISIPKDHHRFIIGKEAATLRQLEAESNCRIAVPPRDSPSDAITVNGPREGIERAIHQIQIISDEQSKLAQERLVIPRTFYPWIRGPYNETLDRLSQETGAKINIPPPSAKSEIIVITGEKDGVHKAAQAVRAIYEEKQQLVKSVATTVARAQHRYVIGPQRSGLADVLKATGVSVEVPPEEEQSDNITLRGDPAKLGDALAMVYAKASSVITAEVPCPSWLHKFIIGPKGSTLNSIVANKRKVQIDFDDDDGGSIRLEGPPEEVKPAQEALDAAVKKFKNEMATTTLKVQPSFHRHIIGRGGSLIGKIKGETGVQVSIPDESTNSDEIKLEGSKEGVVKAAAEIMELVKRMENEKSRDILIEQRFHKQIIGSKGEAIQKLREQYPSVIFSFPEQGRKSDIVALRGDKNEVDKCHKQLTTMVKELQESNFQLGVPIFKEFHKHIVGKGGNNVRKIREETGTRIDLPGEGSGEDSIMVTGKKANVEKAVQLLTQIQNELANIVTVEMSIPMKLHSRLLGGGRRLIQDIQEECGGVQIKFPPEKSNSDKVVLRGPKDDVVRAETLLLDLVKDKELSSHEDSIKAKPEFHRFLIGKGGARIRKVRDAYPSVRILFPREVDTDKETIHLIGRKEDVAKVKQELDKMITELNDIVEVSMDVPIKYHRHFVARGALVLRDLQDQCGGVSISFPRKGDDGTKVTIKGARDCAEEAKTRIDEIVHDLESQVTIRVEIPNEYHRGLLSNRGQRVQEVQQRHNVHIKFPERENREEKAPEHAEGAADENGVEANEDTSLRDIVLISGSKEKCEKAREELVSMIPVTETVMVQWDFHRYLIGRGGATVRELMQSFDVNVTIPPAEQKSDEIKIMGPPGNVRLAVEEVKRKVGEFEEQAKDDELRSHKVTFDIPPEYHQRLIGPRGQTINQLRTKHDVQISVPKQEGDEPMPTITVIGYEANALACKEAIEAMIGDLQNQVSQEITLDARVHPRIIGQRGRGVRKMMDDFKVEIHFPRSNDPDANLVVVSGKSEDAVYDCVDTLRNMEEEFLQEITERGQYMAPKRDEPKGAQQHVQMQMTNAPWTAPDTNSMDDFPSIGPGAPTTNGNATGGVWGRRH